MSSARSRATFSDHAIELPTNEPAKEEVNRDPYEDPDCDMARALLIVTSEDPQWSFAALAGSDGKSMLRRQGDYAERRLPDIILLDLNLPRMDGREVLAEIKGHAEWKSIPVVVLTSSKAEKDIVKSYQLHANCYITKPIDLTQMQEIVQNMKDFWFTVVRLPTENADAR